MIQEYGPEKGKSVFYATKNKRMGFKSHMPAGATQSPKGNLGDRRVAECDAQRGFKNHGGKLDGAAAFGKKTSSPGKIGSRS